MVSVADCGTEFRTWELDFPFWIERHGFNMGIQGIYREWGKGRPVLLDERVNR